MAVRFLHAADFHLDSPFEALSAEQAALRRGEQRELLERLADLANRENVQAVLLAGDLLDSAVSYYETRTVLQNVLGRIRARVFLAPGNHDYWTPDCPYAAMDLPENVTVFHPGPIRAVEVPELGFRVWGTAFQAPAASDLLQGFRAPKSDLVELMVLHGDVGGQSRYSPVTEEDIAASGLDYLALGHVHTASGLQKSGETYWAYPGCPEGRGFDETGTKGVYLGTAEKGNVTLDFVPMAGREYRVQEIVLAPETDPLAAAKAACAEGSARDVRRLIFKGEHRGPVAVAEIAQALEDAAFHLELWDETREPEDLWAGAGNDSLRGITLASLRTAWSQASDEAERQKVTLAVRYALAALDHREEIR